MTRDALADGNLAPEERHDRQRQMEEILADEISFAKQLYAIAKQDSRIGYEASNHYFYVPLDLVEKVINCEWILGTIEPGP